MKEKRGFDMLNNADDKAVDLLSEVPVLTKKEKERMLAMSKKKLDTMNRESNINTSIGEVEVSGVERYKRPKWQIFTTAAACLLLVGGIAGTAFAFRGRGGSPSQQFAEVDVTTTEPVTEHDILPTNNFGMTDEELSAVTEQTYTALNEAIMAAGGYNVEIDTNDCMTDESVENIFGSDSDEAQKYFDEWKTRYNDFYKVTDSRFSSLDDVADYISDRVCGEFKDKLINTLKENYQAKVDGIYCRQQTESYSDFFCDDLAKTEILEKTDSSLTLQSTAVLDGNKLPMKINLELEDGKWKIAEFINSAYRNDPAGQYSE